MPDDEKHQKSGLAADCLLALWRKVEEGGGDEVGGFEDLKVALGGVMAFGKCAGSCEEFLPAVLGVG